MGGRQGRIYAPKGKRAGNGGRPGAGGDGSSEVSGYEVLVI